MSRVVFMGTPNFAVPSLQAVAAHHDVVLCLTRPDAVRSRGKKLEPSPVKVAAEQLNIPVVEANRIDDELAAQLEELQADFFCVAAYGCILPDRILAMPKIDCINVHASLLPRWRGAAPIQRAILADDKLAGVSIMKIGHGVDTGDYCMQSSTSVAGKSAEKLTDELAEMGATLLLRAMEELENNTAVWTVQDESLVTHAAKISKAELALDPALSAHVNALRVLASSDAAPARCMLAAKPARVMSVRELDEVEDADVLTGLSELEGGFSEADLVKFRKRIYLGCAQGVLELCSVKPDGKREMDALSWAAGLHATSANWGVL